MSKTILITGASTGIGKAGALELGRRGWKVFVHARSEARGKPVLDELKQAAPNADFSLVTGDVSSMVEVKSLAEQVKAQTKTLDVLWNNAGLLMDERKVSVDGWEMTMAINHLAPFVLTRELLPLIEQTQGRIITTSSGAHQMGTFNWDDWMDEKSAYSSFKAYSKSKLANILFTRELARGELPQKVSQRIVFTRDWSAPISAGNVGRTSSRVTFPADYSAPCSCLTRKKAPIRASSLPKTRPLKTATENIG